MGYRSAFRHHILLDHIQSIQRNVEFLTNENSFDLNEVLDFEKSYRKAIKTRHGTIIPPFFDATRKIPINEIYVAPEIVSRKNEAELRFASTSEAFFSAMHRTVLLGNPGGGKSTFTLKFCYDLVTNQLALFGQSVTPILVILRDYGAYKKEKRCSILDFIEITSNANYQLPPPKEAFEYLLRNGRVVVIFDGLDELLDTSYRQEISSDVENFCSLFSAVPVLVTSREVGYEQAPLDETRFDIFHLAAFTDEQVADYAHKWFAIDADIPKIQEEQAKAFLRESAVVPDLRSNPLMLALMCNIYKGENYIPKNRPDVYERCATMMFERWDKSRNIQVILPFEAQIRPAMAFLAHWIYSDEALQAGVTEQKLIDQTTDYLWHRRFEDKDEAEKAAREFIEFCKGRAWVFTDTGTTGAGENLYQFTHRTFLEYFTADYLVRTHATTDDLLEMLLPRIENREWDIVAQLAFQNSK